MEIIREHYCLPFIFCLRGCCASLCTPVQNKFHNVTQVRALAALKKVLVFNVQRFGRVSSYFDLLSSPHGETARVRFGSAETIVHCRRVTSPPRSLSASRCGRTDGHRIVLACEWEEGRKLPPLPCSLTPPPSPLRQPRLSPLNFSALLLDDSTAARSSLPLSAPTRLPPSHLVVSHPRRSSPALPHSASVILTLPRFLSPHCKCLPIPSACSATSHLAGHILCSSICSPDLQFHFINTFISFDRSASRPSPSPPPSLCLFHVITFVRPGICALSPPRSTKWTNPWVTSRWKACSEFKAALARQVEI